MRFDWDEHKNQLLKNTRGVCFEDVLVALAEGNDGYWYFTFNDFSATNPTPPELHGDSREYWRAVDGANDRLSEMR